MMNAGRRGLILRWAAGIGGVLLISGGNVLGSLAWRLALAGGMAADTATLLRWCVTAGVWLVALPISALCYALGAAWDRIDAMRMWLSSLDTAVRNQAARPDGER